MNLVKKAMLFCKKEGVKNTLIRTAEKLTETLVHTPGILKEKVSVEYFYHQIEEKVSGKDVYILIPCIDWNIPLFQRPHQIATALSGKPDTQVFFCL